MTGCSSPKLLATAAAALSFAVAVQAMPSARWTQVERVVLDCRDSDAATLPLLCRAFHRELASLVPHPVIGRAGAGRIDHDRDLVIRIIGERDDDTTYAVLSVARTNFGKDPLRDQPYRLSIGETADEARTAGRELARLVACPRRPGGSCEPPGAQ